MTNVEDLYNEIMKISDLNEKEDRLKDFYENQIKIDEWMINDETQKIRFKDRYEYKKNGQYHRLNGPAIEFHNGSKGFYYINGKQLEENKWKEEAKLIMRAKKLSKIK